MLKAFKGVTTYYSTTLSTSPIRTRCRSCLNTTTQSNWFKDTGADVWITSGVIVALGACCELADAVPQLELVLECVKAERLVAESKAEQLPKPEKPTCKPIRRRS